MIYNTFKTISVLFLYLPFGKEISQKTVKSFLEVEVLSQDVEVPHLATHLDKDLDNSCRGSVHNLQKKSQKLSTPSIWWIKQIQNLLVYLLVRKKSQNYQLLLFGRLNNNRGWTIMICNEHTSVSSG